MGPLKLPSVVGLLTTLVFTAIPAPGHAETSVPAVFGSGMVLQREQPIVVWVQDTPGTPVTVNVANREATAKADSNGRWSVKLEELRPEGPHVMTVRGSSRLRFNDVLVGEVWLCSGQSNMEWSVRDSARRELTGPCLNATMQPRPSP